MDNSKKRFARVGIVVKWFISFGCVTMLWLGTWLAITTMLRALISDQCVYTMIVNWFICAARSGAVIFLPVLGVLILCGLLTVRELKGKQTSVFPFLCVCMLICFLLLVFAIASILASMNCMCSKGFVL